MSCHHAKDRPRNIWGVSEVIGHDLNTATLRYNVNQLRWRRKIGHPWVPESYQIWYDTTLT